MNRKSPEKVRSNHAAHTDARGASQLSSPSQSRAGGRGRSADNVGIMAEGDVKWNYSFETRVPMTLLESCRCSIQLSKLAHSRCSTHLSQSRASVRISKDSHHVTFFTSRCGPPTTSSSVFKAWLRLQPTRTPSIMSGLSGP